jgi:signal transduction histidine kinase
MEIILLLLLFPDGRLPSARWRPLLILILAIAVLSIIRIFDPRLFMTGGLRSIPLRVPNPITLPVSQRFFDTLRNKIIGIGFLISLLVAALAIVRRWRQSQGVEREQLKWLAYAGGLIFVAVVVLDVPYNLFHISGNYPLGAIAFVAFMLGVAVGIPGATAMAVLRYRLYDIDVVINKSLVYGSLAAFIAAVYVGIVAGLGALIGTTGRPNLLLSIVATAIVAVAFQPVRQRVERLANRLVYGKRATPYEVLSEFSAKVAGSYAGEEILPRMAQVLGEGTGAASAAVWLRLNDRIAPAASWPYGDGADEAIPLAGDGLPELPASSRVVPVLHQGELLGALSIRKRPGEAVTAVEESLLKDLAAQAGLVLRNVRLTAELQARLEEISMQAAELRASRQRIVATQDAERRRLERNIHDGAQQHLVALTVKLRLAASQAKKDPVRARQTVQALEAETDEALQTLRDLACGIYPPVLREQGLVAALQADTMRMELPIELQAIGVARYPADLEAAAYFSCLEALQNVAKHAQARRVCLVLEQQDGALRFAISDDGRGFDPDGVAEGSGLQNMADRLAALGGQLTVSASPGRGTTITGRLPVSAPVNA